MNLQGRDLKLNHSGGDVCMLQSQLGQLGHTIPNEELEEAIFGSVTHEVITNVCQWNWGTS